MAGVLGGSHAVAVSAVAHGTSEHIAFHRGASVTLGHTLRPQQDGCGQPGRCASSQHYARQQVTISMPEAGNPTKLSCGIQMLKLNSICRMWLLDETLKKKKKKNPGTSSRKSSKARVCIAKELELLSWY